MPKGKYIRTDAHRKALSDASKSRIRFPHSEETKRKIGEAQKGVPRPHQRGEKHGMWKGGVTSINQAIRHSIEQKQWVKDVFERDDYTCQDCGDKGVKLNAHHLKSFSLFPELRLELDNGQTLCVPCHRKTDNWGSGKIALNKK